MREQSAEVERVVARAERHLSALRYGLNALDATSSTWSTTPSPAGGACKLVVRPSQERRLSGSFSPAGR